MSFNRAEFIGNLGSDARIAKVGDKDVANFSIAINDKRNEDKTIWVRCALWGALVPKIGQHLVKGKQVFVSGPIDIEEWTTKDGEVKRDLRIFVNDIQLLGGTNTGESKAKEQEKQKPKPNPVDQNPFG
jgi:single-strand DNA-binding protein